MRHTLVELENERKKILNDYENLIKEKVLIISICIKLI